VTGTAEGDRPAHQQLADAIRDLVTAAMATAASLADIRQAAAAVDSLAARLSQQTLDDPWWTYASVDPRPGLAWRMPLNAVSGALNPLAPPVIFETVDGEVRGRARLGLAYVGPPGTVHGGWVTAMLDDALGLACVAGGHGGFTASLTVNFRRPTPLGADLELVARMVELDGRKGWAEGAIKVNGVVTADARGLFVRPAIPPAP
jgi:acyl-coenzyme A thioesterase PaaI-like protein